MYYTKIQRDEVPEIRFFSKYLVGYKPISPVKQFRMKHVYAVVIYLPTM